MSETLSRHLVMALLDSPGMLEWRQRSHGKCQCNATATTVSMSDSTQLHTPLLIPRWSVKDSPRATVWLNFNLTIARHHHTNFSLMAEQSFILKLPGSGLKSSKASAHWKSILQTHGHAQVNQNEQPEKGPEFYVQIAFYTTNSTTGRK